MSKLTLQTVVGVGYKLQSALQEANLATEYFRLSKLNSALASVNAVTEDNAAEFGKGHEFATDVFPVSMDVNGNVEKYISSEMMAWLFGMALGKVTETADGTGGMKYVITPTTVCDPLELPSFSVCEQVAKECGATTLDRSLVGNVISDWNLRIGTGPTRQSGMFTANYVGCGKVVTPSGIVLPTTALTEHLLRANSATVSVLGTNYVTAKNMVSLELSGQNNPRLDQGFYPGSGVDANGFALRGRMERGARAFGLNVVGRYDAGSTELSDLYSLTAGSASFSLTGPMISTGVFHSLKVTFPACKLKSATLADDQGVITVATSITPIYDSVLGVISVEVVTDTTGIAQ